MDISYHIASISKLVNGKIVGPSNLNHIRVLLIDSRRVVEPSTALFIAIVGEQHDGHKYVGQLVQRGFKSFLVSRELELPNDCCQVIVNDTLVALQEVAKIHRQKFNYSLIGITGSNGKTVVKEWLFQLLQADLNVVRSPKSYNSQIGVPLSVWKMSKDNELALIEAGISKVGEMVLLEKIIRPNDVILTNIHEAHDENFTDRFDKAKEKLSLAKDAERIFYCSDYKEIAHGVSKLANIKKISWSVNDEKCNFYVKKVKKTGKNSKIDAIYAKNEIKIEIPFTDNASIENAIHCWLYLLENGYKNSLIAERMIGLVAVTMRLDLKAGINGNTLINDSYNSDIASLGIALDLLNQQHQHSKKALILSDIYESGQVSSALYKEIAQLVRSKNIDRIIGVGNQLLQNQDCFELMDAHFFETTEHVIAELLTLQFENEAILIKGSRPFQFEKISRALEQKSHETVLEINLTAIQNNLNYYRSLLKPSTKVMVMVKAFSYGSGTHEIASIMQFNNVDYLGVAYADEGVALRKAGIKTPIMVMNPEREAFHSMIKYKLEPEIYNLELLQGFIGMLKTSLLCDGSVFPIHIKLDTGMHRLGFEEEELSALLAILEDNALIKVQSVFSHLVGSGDKKYDEYTISQLSKFDAMALSIETSLSYQFDRHILNSSGVERFPDSQYDMVRIGIGIHGVGATPKTQRNIEQVATLKSSISQIRNVKKGETVGYNRSGIADQNMRIATIAIGYADGFSRRLGNGNGYMIVNGTSATVVGDVCMDMCMLDVSSIACKEGDTVVIFGDPNYSLLNIAIDLGTIPYEVLTSISQRVKRVYFWE